MEHSGPHPLRVLLGALLATALGVVLAGVELALEPAKQVSVAPSEEEIEPGVVYYVKGTSQGGRRYRDKLASLDLGHAREVRFTESELNRWSIDTFRFGRKDGRPGKDLFGFGFEAEAPDFRIAKGQLQAATRLTLPKLGRDAKITFQARGKFDANGRLAIEQAYLGSCPLPGVAGPLFGWLTGIYGQTEPGRETQQQLAGGTLALAERELLLRK